MSKKSSTPRELIAMSDALVRKIERLDSQAALAQKVERLLESAAPGIGRNETGFVAQTLGVSITEVIALEDQRRCHGREWDGTISRPCRCGRESEDYINLFRSYPPGPDDENDWDCSAVLYSWVNYMTGGH